MQYRIQWKWTHAHHHIANHFYSTRYSNRAIEIFLELCWFGRWADGIFCSPKYTGMCDDFVILITLICVGSAEPEKKRERRSNRMLDTHWLYINIISASESRYIFCVTLESVFYSTQIYWNWFSLVASRISNYDKSFAQLVLLEQWMHVWKTYFGSLNIIRNAFGARFQRIFDSKKINLNQENNLNPMENPLREMQI